MCLLSGCISVTGQYLLIGFMSLAKYQMAVFKWLIMLIYFISIIYKVLVRKTL